MLLSVLGCSAPVEETQPGTLPVTGTWVNFAYKDVRNKYTNPLDADMTDPALWRAKVGELHTMGMEVLVLMEVANDELSFYPSSVMEPAYDTSRECPVEAVLDEAAKYGMKVFMSTGWARNQDDDLRDPWVQERQQKIMEELTALYGDKPSFYGWYLPVEDCIAPVFPRSAVDAVNRLVARARELTPDKKTLISPYGMVYGNFSNPEMARNIRSLKVDIIAYQDEIGCVREPYPLPRLLGNWLELAKIHKDSGIEMWANCETFTWEAGTNDRTSALIPAAYERLLQQQIIASKAGVGRILSFMFPGIIEDPGSEFPLGQPEFSNALWRDYMAWLGGDEGWLLTESVLSGEAVSADFEAVGYPALSDGVYAELRPDADGWVRLEPGEYEITLTFPEALVLRDVVVRCLDCGPAGVLAPSTLELCLPDGTVLSQLNSVTWPSKRHDTWADCLVLSCPGSSGKTAQNVDESGYSIPSSGKTAQNVDESPLESVVLKLSCPSQVYIDEILVNCNF